MSKEYTLETIHEFFDELDNRLNPNISKMIVWAGYEKDRQRQIHEKEIEDIFDCPGYYYNATIVTEDIAIVKEFKRGEIIGFFPCVNKKKSHCLYPTFDKAFLAALSIKYLGNEDAAEWMWKMLSK